MNLLIVNDEEQVTKAVKDSIDWAKYGISKVFVSFNAEDAWDIIMEEDVDVLLCDIEMPGASGLELCSNIRSEGLDMKIIFWTCHAKFDYAKQAISLQCDDYILMPAGYDEIGAVVARSVRSIEEKREKNRYQMYYENLVEKSVRDYESAGMGKISPKDLADRCEQLILQNLNMEDLSLTFLAGNLHVHPVYLSRVFSQFHSISVKQFIISERMKQAAELLSTGKLSVAAVAEQVGYRNTVNFANMFRKTFNMTPRQYTQSRKNPEK